MSQFVVTVRPRTDHAPPSGSADAADAPVALSCIITDSGSAALSCFVTDSGSAALSCVVGSPAAPSSVAGPATPLVSA